MFLSPGDFRTPRQTVPVTAGSVPYEFITPLSLATAPISTYADASGVNLMFGSNCKQLSDGSIGYTHLAQSGAGFILDRLGAVNFYRNTATQPCDYVGGFGTAGFTVRGRGGFDANGAAILTLTNPTFGGSIKHWLTDAGLYAWNKDNGDSLFAANLTTNQFDFYNSTSNVNFNGTGTVRTAGDVFVNDSA
jgi:hypothetical protein